MMEDKVYGPGHHTIEVTLRSEFYIPQGESATENELVDDCRKLGEMVDWEVE